jgi:hypothetical protein
MALHHGFPGCPVCADGQCLWRRNISISNIHIELAGAAYRAFKKARSFNRSMRLDGVDACRLFR